MTMIVIRGNPDDSPGTMNKKCPQMLVTFFRHIHQHLSVVTRGLAPIFPYTFYHLIHHWFAAADIHVANDIPVHYADAIRCNVRRPPQGSLPLLTRRALA